ncbi:hypothetical protein [Cytobacillus horneckiae]|uniref:hypothetical protein n=1 Tax=Cytobacillus horneckiae TaxID=549687 RepID=UPI000AEC0666
MNDYCKTFLKIEKRLECDVPMVCKEDFEGDESGERTCGSWLFVSSGLKDLHKI